ncbi:MAG: GIY-YIG nuclease family protein [Saprospiraceae bacterium]|nr:GIY-YIG nuclease family protein [Saprospiraceae bacterium]
MAKRPSLLQYAVVDIETTGGRPDRDKITEIGIVLTNGREITDRWSSLVNPGVTIPDFITRMTGITQEMVQDAPYFHEIARDVILRLEHAVFVAHNARFDYHFIRESFMDLGFPFSRPFLCTVKMSRQAFPGLPSYSLGNLIRHFGIPAENRHRALDDALATADLLSRILQSPHGPIQEGASVKTVARWKTIPNHLSPDKLADIPDACGVYYFRNPEGQIIYVGKSVHMRKRLQEHLQDITRKADRLEKEIADVQWVVTGSDLYASLLEAAEIKRWQPPVNRAQRQRHYEYGLWVEPTAEGYLRFEIRRLHQESDPVQRYSGKRTALQALASASRQFGLCRHLTVSHGPPQSPCFEYHLGECQGACCGQESPEAYNTRVRLAAAHLRQDIEGSFYLLDTGPDPRTQTVFAVRDGRFAGMGMLPVHADRDQATLEAAIQSYPYTPENQRILRQYLIRHRLERIPFQGILRPE